MTEGASSTAQAFGPQRILAVDGFSWRALLAPRWKVALVVLAVASAGVAVWITLDARFLEYREWLAVQKADFILGPIAVGLYWHSRRPENRFGLLLIVLGLVSIPYILTSSPVPVLFGIGAMWGGVIYLATSVVILAFPNGQLGGVAERLIIAAVLIAVTLTMVVQVLTVPDLTSSLSISGCHGGCPRDGLAIWSTPSWLPQLQDFQGYMLVAIPLAILALYVWRFLTGTPPRVRALAIGGPIVVLFLVMQMSYRTLLLIEPNGLSASAPAHSVLQTVAATRSILWYGFLFALIGAELYAGRVLRRLVGNSLGRPTFRELEGLVRGPLGDPGLRLGFWRTDTSEWVDADGGPLAPPGSDQRLTEIDRDGRAMIAIIHDQQLLEDPELLRASGAVALLALENAELDAAWKESLRALADSRVRLTRASDKERRNLERDLHDGAQQRLLAALIRLSSAEELAGDSPELERQLTITRVELESALQELRDLARGIYPTVLGEVGLAGALRSVALRSPERITVKATGQRFAPETETALYYCCLEAVQNTFKHAGLNAQTSIRLFTADGELWLEVRDTGIGFDPATQHDGVGLQSMHDRLDAVGGHVEISSRPGRGTVVTAKAPTRQPFSKDHHPH